MNTSVTYSFEDDKLRIYNLSRWDDEQFANIRANGFRWAPKQELFYSMWSPTNEDFSLQFGEVENEQKTLLQRAEEKAERLAGASIKAAHASNSAYESAKHYSARFADGQPILIGHHSERSARVAAKRADNAMRRSVERQKDMERLAYSASAVINHAEYKSDARTIQRRIKTLTAELRKHERNCALIEKKQLFWSKPNILLDDAIAFTNTTSVYINGEHVWSLLTDGKKTPNEIAAIVLPQYPAYLANQDCWIEHYEQRIFYEQSLLDKMGIVAEPKKKSVRASSPICNFDQDGAIHMTKAEYTALPNDYKGLRVYDSEDKMNGKAGNCYRYRVAMGVFIKYKIQHLLNRDLYPTNHQMSNVTHSYYKIFLTDSKIVPKPEGETIEPVLFEPMTVKEKRVLPDTVSNKISEAKQVLQIIEPITKPIEVGSNADAHYTPMSVCIRMVHLLGDCTGLDFLEPSSGSGNLALSIIGLPSRKVAIEADNVTVVKHMAVFKANGFDLRQLDFLGYAANTSEKFDRIIMNPPFSNGKDILHVQAALSLLKPGGVLVGLCANGSRQHDKLKPLCSYWDVLPSDTFPMTNVITAIFKIEKSL